MTSDQRIKAEMDKKKDKDQNWLEQTFCHGEDRVKSKSDTCIIAVQIIKNSFLSPNPEGLQFFILTIVPRAKNSRCCF